MRHCISCDSFILYGDFYYKLHTMRYVRMSFSFGLAITVKNFAKQTAGLGKIENQIVFLKELMALVTFL